AGGADFTAALVSHRAALAIFDRLARADPSPAEWQPGLAVSRRRVGGRAPRALAAALARYRAAPAIVQRLARADPGNAEWQRDLSAAHNRIGDVRQAQGDLTAGLASHRGGRAGGGALGL